MNQNRLKVTIIVLVMFFINGCFSHVGTQKNNFLMAKVSTEDKKLLSYYDDEVLYLYNGDVIFAGKVMYSYKPDQKIMGKKMQEAFQYKSDGIRITKNGFYPNCKIADTTLTSEIVKDKQYCHKTKYMKQSLGDLLTKFNMNKFMHDINEANLKELRLAILSINKIFPSFDIRRLTEKEIIKFTTLSLYEKQKKLVDYQPSIIKNIMNPSEELKEIALTSHKRKCSKRGYLWNYKKNDCDIPSYRPPSSSSSESYSSSGGSSASGGYSGSSSSGNNNSNYVPGRGYYRPGQGHGHSSQY